VGKGGGVKVEEIKMTFANERDTCRKKSRREKDARQSKWHRSARAVKRLGPPTTDKKGKKTKRGGESPPERRRGGGTAAEKKEREGTRGRTTSGGGGGYLRKATSDKGDWT